MASRVGKHLRSNLVAYVALLFALGLGSAWALERNSVESKHIAPDAAKGVDIDEKSLELAAGRWHEVGTPGEPAFNEAFYPNGSLRCGWENYDGGSSHNSAAFLRDRHGFVHLKGLVRLIGPECRTSIAPHDYEVFTLPEGYRPAKREVQVSITNGLVARIDINGPAAFEKAAGAVSLGSADGYGSEARVWLSLDGITFRCAPSGQNGCP